MQKQGTHQSEWDWMGSKFDYIIENNSSIEELNANTDQVIHQLQDHQVSNVTS